jgi:hypothetical protein
MEEIRGSPARRLSQILDPIVRLTSELNTTSSAPCSPKLNSRLHNTCSEPSSLGQEYARITSAVDNSCLKQRRGKQGPTPPPRPKNNNSPIHYRDSPYINIPNLSFQKDKSLIETTKNPSYMEPVNTSGPSTASTKTNSNPYNFTSESSGYVEYVDGRPCIDHSIIDFESTCYENKTQDIQNIQLYGKDHSIHDFGVSINSSLETNYTIKQQLECQSKYFFADKGNISSSFVQQETVKEPKIVYASSKSFDGYSNTVEELNWQERCLELQLELHRSRNKASRVRDMLREKVSSSKGVFYMFICFCLVL